VAVNTHYLAAAVQRFLEENGPLGLALKVSHEPDLLGTGGGLRNLARLLGEGPFLVVNGDILSDLDYAAVFRGWCPEALATLVLHDCPPYNLVWVDGEGLVRGIGARPGGVAGPPMAYTGVQVVSPGMLKYLPGTGPYDLVQAWREALAAGERLAALVVSGHFWQDLGTPAGYLAAHRRLLQGQGPGLVRFFPEVGDPLLGPGVEIANDVVCAGGVCLAAGVRVEAGTHLRNTVAWEGAWIGPGVSLENCIVGPHARVSRSVKGEILV
jgi:mannose-1-phosphate guanylyltransferase